MKISKLFHSLYAIIMFLPVMVIPIFALNILHKETEPISIEVYSNKTIDFNQLSNPNNLTPTTEITGLDWTNNHDGSIKIEGYTTSAVYKAIYNNNVVGGFEIGHKYAFYGFENLSIFMTINTSGITISQPSVLEATSINTYFELRIPNNTIVNTTLYMQYSDLTNIYGEGNEPTIQEFLNTFNETYYPYTTSTKMLVNDVLETYNNTDIGSQFVYALYKPVHDYFNVSEFFGLGALEDWFLLNLFSGNVNTIVFSVLFDLAIYWLAVSLFWLIFDVLMYVPSMVHKMLDKARLE